MDRSARGSDVVTLKKKKLHGRRSGCGCGALSERRAARGLDRSKRKLLLRCVFGVVAMESTRASRPGSGFGFFGGCVIAGVNVRVFRSLFPSIPHGRVPSSRGSRRKMALVREVV